MQQKLFGEVELVVNVKKTKIYDVYIGRQNNSYHLKMSKWHNPFKVGRDGDLTEVLRKYREYLFARPDLMAALPELKGKVLGCWCKPDSCHGDILAELANKEP